MPGNLTTGYVYIYIYTDIQMCVYMCVYIYIYILTITILYNPQGASRHDAWEPYNRIYIYIYIYTHTYIHRYIDTQIHRYIDTQIHRYIDTQIHRYIDTQIDTYIQTERGDKGQIRPISLLRSSLLRLLDSNFLGNSRWAWESAGVKPSEIHNLSTEIGRKPLQSLRGWWMGGA